MKVINEMTVRIEEHTGAINFLKGEGAVVATASFNNETVLGQGGSYEPEITFNEVNVPFYDIVFIPGGDGPRHIIHHQDNQTVINILTRAHNEGKIIAAICHGPWVLAAADLVDRKIVTCWNDPFTIDDLKAHGATVDLSKSVVRDGNIITGNGPGAINELAEEIIKAVIQQLTIRQAYARITTELEKQLVEGRRNIVSFGLLNIRK